MSLPPDPTGTFVVFGLIGIALFLFLTEWIPNDMTAVGVLVSLAVLEPVTGVSAGDAVSGFGSAATVTLMAMYILSEGVQRTGAVGILGSYIERTTEGSQIRLLGATVGATGLSAGIVNNTPIVAVFIPMVQGIARKTGTSPSKLLLPLSYAAMLGGTLTVLGSTTNILVSDLTRSLLERGSIRVFEFTKLGVVVFGVGAVYLLTVGRYLTPDRIDPSATLTEAFGLGGSLRIFEVTDESSLVGKTVDEVETEIVSEVDLLQIRRDAETYVAATTDQRIDSGDVLVVRARREAARSFAHRFGLRRLWKIDVTAKSLHKPEGRSRLVEAVVVEGSRLVGKTVEETGLEEQLDTKVLAVRRGDEVVQSVDELSIRNGDSLLLQTTEGSFEFLKDSRDIVVTRLPDVEEIVHEPVEEEEETVPLSSKTPVALGVMAGVVGVAALGLVPIVIAALGGVVVMVASGCIDTNQAYDAVSWRIIFLLAGILPLGVAMQRTGGDQLIASLIAVTAEVLPPIGVLGLVYVLTSLIASLITPVASTVLMAPIAVEAASRVGSEGFPFLLGVMFGANAAFMTPIGYQTNLMVYSPGSYRFTDYLRLGAPLQALLAVVTTVGIDFFWGV
ncbi:SLC13 family permease [Halorutilales archaeon Cl-col2-1]